MKILNRITICAFLVLFQIIFVFLIARDLEGYSTPIYIIFTIICVLEFMSLISKQTLPEVKLAWLIPIMLLPVFGILLYLIYSKRQLSTIVEKKVEKVKLENKIVYTNNNTECIKNDENSLNISNYIYNCSGLPMQCADELEYFNFGEKYFDKILLELKKAEKFIFIEFFIIYDGELWQKIFAILQEKAKAGIEIEKYVNDNFDFSVSNMIEELDLLKPIYKQTACYGHFGRKEFSWEKIK